MALLSWSSKFHVPWETISLFININSKSFNCEIYQFSKHNHSSKIFQNFNSMIQTQFQTKIQLLKTDNAKEYFNSVLGTYYLSQDIIHISSCVDTSQQNRVAQRKNTHLLEVALFLMFSINVPKHFWREVVFNVVYLINIMPFRINSFHTPK